MFWRRLRFKEEKEEEEVEVEVEEGEEESSSVPKSGTELIHILRHKDTKPSGSSPKTHWKLVKFCVSTPFYHLQSIYIYITEIY